MITPEISIVVVSHKRPHLLRQVLTALRLQTHVSYEIIVVADNDPEPKKIDKDYHHILFSDANISIARNLGYEAARADIVAFCDDDAIPEPTWAAHLIRVFENPEVIAATGRVKARNGFSDQWPVVWSDRTGLDQRTELWPNSTVSHPCTEQAFVKLQGTNMAFRRTCLEELSGFDSTFAYFLDETDIALRAARRWAGSKFAVVPDAVVHHLFAESQTRSHARAPKSMRMIMQSVHHFLEKHYEVERAEVLSRYKAAQRFRIFEALKIGNLQPSSANRLLQELDEVPDPPRAMENVTSSQNTSMTHSSKRRSHYLIASTRRHRRMAKQHVLELVASGALVTFLDLSLTPWAQIRGFDPSGFWYQSGGLFGQHDRSTNKRFRTLREASIETAARLKKMRPVDEIIYYSPLQKKPAKLIV